MDVDLTLPQLCGQLIVGGFEGVTLPGPFAEALGDGERSGAILFARNLPTLIDTHALCQSILATAPPALPPFIGLDEEGGQVTRLPPEAPRLPPMRRLGALGNPGLVERAARAVGTTLAALGFNIDFAPVLDVDSNPGNPVIGDRSFAPHAARVADLGEAFVRGLQSAGVMACGKHFPGHGDTSQDSHLDLPAVTHDRSRLDRVELVPFRRAAAGGVAAMMSAHVVFTTLDPVAPATLSRPICTELLRGELGFAGVLFSDGMEMRALSDPLTIEHNAPRAVEAGCDALLVCHDLDLQQRAHAALLARAETDGDFRHRCIEAVERSLRARRRAPPHRSERFDPGALAFFD